MKNKWLVLAGAAVFAAFTTVQAAPIVGSIGFSGGFTATGEVGSDLTTASQFVIGTVANPLIIAGGATGIFTTAITPTFLSPVLETGANLNGNQLWTVKIGGVTYDMLVTSATRTQNNPSQVNFAGNGLLQQNGAPANDTAGSWQLQFGQTGAALIFSATSANNIPDGGATVMLLGAALSAMGLLRRKLIA